MYIRRTLAGSTVFKRFFSKAFQKTESVPAPDLDGLIARADQFTALNQLEECVDVLAPWQDVFGEDTAYLSRLGFALFNLSRYHDAADPLRVVLRLEPENIPAIRVLVATLYGTEEFDEAIYWGKQAIALGKSDDELYNAMGAIYLRIGELDAAVASFEDAVRFNTSNVQAQANLQVTKNRFSALGVKGTHSAEMLELRSTSIERLTASLHAGALTPTDLTNLLNLLGNARDTWPTSVRLFEEYAGRDNLSAAAAAGIGSIATALGDRAAALRLYEMAYSQDPLRVEMIISFSNALIAQGGARWNEGWRLYGTASRKINPTNYPVSTQWVGQDISGERLFVHLDQGVGDAIIGLRFIPMLAERGIRVVLWVLPNLVEIARSVAQWTEEIVHSGFMPDPVEFGCALSCGLFDLPGPLGLTDADISTFPTFLVPEDVTERWRAAVPSDSRKTVALIATGNPRRSDDWTRSVPRLALEPLRALGNIRWVNLSVDKCPELETIVNDFEMLDVTSEVKTFADTAAILALADAVVAIDCAAAHLSLALRKPTWIFMPKNGDWRWQIGDQISPWWPDAHCHPSQSIGEWSRAALNIAQELDSFIRGQAPG